MSQFDSSSAAALAQIKLDVSLPVDAAVSRVAGIGSRLLELGGFLGAATLNDLIQELKKLAANKDEANLVYFGEALVDDISRLYRLNDEMRKTADELLKGKEFHQAVENATLHITRTNVEVRIQRVAILITNGVKLRDLEPDSLDDMMRAAVELTEWDIFVLGKMYDSQKQILLNQNWSHNWSEQVGNTWTNWNAIFGVGEQQHLKLRSALARLQSIGLIAEVQTNFVKDGSLARQAFGLLPEGKRFFERISEIDAKR